jgi:hypothetical protein
MEKILKNLSTAEEIKKRKDPLFGGFAKVYDFFKSELVFASPYEENKVDYTDTLIVIFKDGSQANMTTEEFKKL